jgi:hypothetical protein
LEILSSKADEMILGELNHDFFNGQKIKKPLGVESFSLVIKALCHRN